MHIHTSDIKPCDSSSAFSLFNENVSLIAFLLSCDYFIFLLYLLYQQRDEIHNEQQDKLN